MKILKVSILVLVLSCCSLQVMAKSLWNERSSGFLFVDHKARTIGDIITIVVSEEVSISKTGETTTDKKDTVVGRVASFLFPSAVAVTQGNTGSTGLITDKGYTGSRFGQHNGTLPAWDWKTEQKFEGGGTIKNDDVFTAKITAQVVDVLPNGQMLIEGRRMLNLSNEKQQVLITGKIRAQDVSENNTIDSEKIADLRVTYEGKGPIGDNQRRGVLTRLWDIVGLL